MKVSVQYAAEHFEELVLAVYDGDEVEFLSTGHPALMLVPRSVSSTVARAGSRVFGPGKAFRRLPTPDGLDRIDNDWKREIQEKSIGAGTE